MLPVYVETEDSDCADAWLERDGQRGPLRRVVDGVVDPAVAPPVHPTVAAVEAAREAPPDKRTRETIAVVARAIAAVGPVMAAVERVGPAARVGLPTLPPLPDLPALPSAAIGLRPLSMDELQELERVGLGLPSLPAIA
jgi:hypothetical protein